MRLFAAKMPPYFVGALLITFSFATISLPARMLHIPDSIPHRLLTKSKARHQPGALRSVGEKSQ
jgi:hypothetical protein